jgi:hypothetical protein
MKPAAGSIIRIPIATMFVGVALVWNGNSPLNTPVSPHPLVLI